VVVGCQGVAVSEAAAQASYRPGPAALLPGDYAYIQGRRNRGHLPCSKKASRQGCLCCAATAVAADRCQNALRVPRPPRFASRLLRRCARRSSLSRMNRDSLSSNDLGARPRPRPGLRAAEDGLFTWRMERPILPSRTLMTLTLTMSFSLR